MLHLLIWPSGAENPTGKTIERALGMRGAGKVKAAADSDFSDILYLAPSWLKVKESQGIFHRMLGRRTYVPPRMLTLRQLARSLCQTRSGRLVLPAYLKVPLLMRISGLGAGRAGELASFMAEMKDRFPGLSAGEIKNSLGPVFSETGTPREVSDRITGALDYAGQYCRILEEGSFLDEDDTLPAAARLLEDEPPETQIILDGFFELTHAEKVFIGALIKNSRQTIAAVPFDPGFKGVTEDYISFLENFSGASRPGAPEAPATAAGKKPFIYYSYPSREEEVEGMARSIKAAYISGACRDLSSILILFPNPGEYSDMAGRVFAKYGLPPGQKIFSGPDAVSARRRADILALLDTGSVSNLAALACSPYFTSIPEAIRKFAPGATLLKRGFEPILEENSTAAPEFKRFIKRLAPLEKALRKETGLASGLVKSFEDALRALGFSAGEYGEELAGRLRALALTDSLGAGRFAPGQAKEALINLINSFLPADEAPGNQITIRITSLEAASGLSSHGSLYIGGLKDGDIPSRPAMDYLLPERLRSRLGLQTVQRHLLVEEFEFRRLLLSPGRGTKTLHLSYPEMESDKLFLPSVFLSEGEKRAPDRVPGIFSKEEEMTLPATLPYSGRITEIKAASLKGRRRMYITDIDAFRRCPRRFFIEKEMGLLPPEAEEMPPEPRTVGTVIHKVMEEAIPAVKDGFDAFSQKASRALDEALVENNIEPYWAEVLKATFMEQARGVYELELELSSGGFQFGRAESRVEGVLAGLHLYGKADRIDTGPGGAARIIDYKTGEAKLHPAEVLKKGAALQMFLYAALLSAGRGDKIASVGLYSLKDLQIKFLPGKRDAKKGVLIEDYISKALQYLEETADQIRAGDFSARPLEDAACRKCPEKPYCPRNNNPGKGHGRRELP